MTAHRSVLAAVVAAGCLLAACGDDGGSTSAPSTTTSRRTGADQGCAVGVDDVAQVLQLAVAVVERGGGACRFAPAGDTAAGAVDVVARDLDPGETLDSIVARLETSLGPVSRRSIGDGTQGYVVALGTGARAGVVRGGTLVEVGVTEPGLAPDVVAGHAVAILARAT